MPVGKPAGNVAGIGNPPGVDGNVGNGGSPPGGGAGRRPGPVAGGAT